MSFYLKKNLKEKIILTALCIFIFWLSFLPTFINSNSFTYLVLYLIFFLVFLIFLDKRKNLKYLKESNLLVKILPFLIFMASFLESVIFASEKFFALKIYLHLFLPLLIICYLMNILFRSYKNIVIKKLPRLICIISLIIGGLGLIEIIFRWNFIYEYFIRDMYYEKYISKVIPHPMGTQYHPSALATFLLFCIPFNFIVFRDKIRFFSVLSKIALILNIFILMFTFSRAALIGLLVLTAVYFLTRKKYFILIIILVLFISIILVGSLTSHPNLKKYGIDEIIISRKKGSSSIFSKYRMIRVKMSMEMLKDNPFFGVGLMHFRKKFDTYIPTGYFEVERDHKIADNMYLTILAETGIVGGLGFLFFLFYICKISLEKLIFFNNFNHKLFLLSIFSGFVGLSINMVGYELFYWGTPYLCFCMVTSMLFSLANS